MTYVELTKALKNMKNEKSPGLDGFTVEFFKFFWIDIGVFVLRSINYGYITGPLSVTQKQGIITCLPKPNKCRYNLKKKLETNLSVKCSIQNGFSCNSKSA